MILTQIAAIGTNLEIGKDNTLLWRYPEDLQYFKGQTTGKVLIMGRKTFDSIGRPLPKRFHIVVTRSTKNKTSDNENVIYVQTLAAAYDAARTMVQSGSWPEEVMVCGGAEIYKQTLDDCDFLYLTRIPEEAAADSFYPANFVDKFSRTVVRESTETKGLIFEIWSRNRIIS